MFNSATYFLIFLFTFLFATVAKSSPLVEKAIDQNIHKSQYWRRLIHYEKTFFGSKSEAKSDQFFVSPNGKTNPKEELISTIEKMFIEKDHLILGDRKSTQCRFLARRKFLINELNFSSTEKKNMLARCEFRENWKKRLNPKSMSLIFASSYMNNPASMFGHTFFKFSTKNNDYDLLNYGVNFAASTGEDGGMSFALRGIFGLYPGFFSLKPYHVKIVEYADLENRDIWEYELNFSEEEIDQLLNHLLELEQTYFPYYFLSKNCSYQLLKVLEVARPSLNLADEYFYEVIPSDTIKQVYKKDLIQNVYYRPSLQSQINKELETFTKKEKVIYKKLLDRENVKDYSTKVLDLAILALSQKSDAKEYLFKLQNKRSQIKEKNTRQELIKTVENAPHFAHDSAKIQLGSVYDEKKVHPRLTFQFAYHDILSPSIGQLPRSELNIFKFDTRFNSVHENFYLDKFTMVGIKSYPISNGVDSRLSWNFSLMHRRQNYKQTGFDIGVGKNYSFNDHFYYLFLLKHSHYYDHQVDRFGYLYIGYETGFYFDFEKVKSEILFTQNRDLYLGEKEEIYSIKTRVTPFKYNQVEFGFNRMNDDSTYHIDFIYYFSI